MEVKINYEAKRLAPEMTIGKENFVLLRHNPTTDVYVYERTYGPKSNRKKCIEVIRPIYQNYNDERIALYPSTSKFGQYGYCCSINDRYLQEKINFWLKNGIVSYTTRKAANMSQKLKSTKLEF